MPGMQPLFVARDTGSESSVAPGLAVVFVSHFGVDCGSVREQMRESRKLQKTPAFPLVFVAVER